MKRFILSFILIMIFFNVSSVAYTYSPEEIRRIEVMLNENYLESAQRDELIRIKDKLSKYEVLTKEENEYIRLTYLEVIRKKLGDAKFDEYCKLLEKREKAVEFTQPERFRLYELEKELKSIK